MRRHMFKLQDFLVSLYNVTMTNKPLIKTNPYLKDPAKRKELFIITVASLPLSKVSTPR